MAAIVKFFIERPLATNLISFMIILLGTLSFFQLKRQPTPLVDMDQLRIVSVVPAASPEEIELSVTTKIEEALESVNGIEKHRSTSSEGKSVIEIFIDPEAPDKEKVKSDVRRAVETVEDLPEEMEESPQVHEIKVEEIVVYEMAIIYDNYQQARILQTARELKRKLLDFPGIAKVRYNGIPEREVRIRLDPRKLRRYQVGIDEVIQVIQQNKIRLSAGMLKSTDQEKGIITISDFEDPTDIAKLVIRSTSAGRRILIGDVAEVVNDFTDEDKIVKFNGQRGGSLMLIKKSSADIIDLVEQIEALKSRYLTTGSPDLKLVTTWDFSSNTRTRLDIVSSNLAAGFVLVLVVLFLFLDYRVAFWTAIGIPIAIAGALILMPKLDISINSVSLCGMILVLGMIVDDAIIIAENIYRQMENGIAAKEAAYEGLRQVIKPVFGTIVTSIIAFLPLYFLPGMIGDFSIEVPTTVNLMLLASFLEAVLILPSHLAHRKRKANGDHRPPTPPGQILIQFLARYYQGFLTRCLRFRWTTLAIVLGLTAAGFYMAAQWSNFRMFDLSQSSRIYLMGDVTDGASLAFTEKQVAVLDDIIEDFPPGIIKTYKHTIGVEGTFKGVRFIAHSSFLSEIVLTPFTERDMIAEEVSRRILHEAQERLGANLKTLDVEIDSEGPPVGRPLEIRIVGDERRTRTAIIDRIVAILEDYPVTEVTADNDVEKQEIRILPDYNALAKSGLNVSQIATTIRTAVDGMIVTHLQTPIERIPFRVIMKDKRDDFEDPLAGLLVRNQFGHLIPVNQVMMTKTVTAPRKILHYNGHPSNLITANFAPGASPRSLYQQVEQELVKLRQEFPGYTIKIGGEAQESHKFIRQILMLLALAVFGIYSWLVLQLNSLMQPFMVVLAIPFGLLGVLLAFITHQSDLSLLALVGLVGVGGVLVNDSLIMVEFINRIVHQEQKDIDQAIIQGAFHRFRPIMLTTLTTVMGLLPTAYGIIGGTDAFISPLVFAMTWGLMVGTPSVLLVIPLLYGILFNPRGRGSQAAA
jgi:multidrug efflux pump subunit AcrB